MDAQRTAIVTNHVIAFAAPKWLATAVAAIGLIALPTSASAKDAVQPAVTQIYGRDACPQNNVGEIIVCARQSDGAQYRIPIALRDEGQSAAGPGEAWGDKVEATEAATSFTMPDGCSAAGSYGQTGC